MYKIFISYKSGAPNDQEAQLLYNELVKRNNAVFLDKRMVHPGMVWDEAIYSNISDSDVLIVLVTENAHSHWVQREVDFALGCRVSILPVIFKDTPKVFEVLKSLVIDKFQFVEAFGSGNPDQRFAEIFKFIPTLAKETRKKQEAWGDELQKRWRKQDDANPLLQPYRPTDIKHASYAYFSDPRHAHSCTLHITAGNMTDVENIDALVNSENVYMQMQRVFERPSVSKIIRMNGAKSSRDHTFETDPIQQQLNDTLFGPNGRGIPVNKGEVIVTSSGEPDSKLNRKGIQHIFHVAVLDANTTKQFPVEDPEDVGKCVINCLDKVREMNANGSAIKSIIFPVLASGNAGLEFSKSVEIILRSFKEFLQKHSDTQLEDIYLAGYTFGDVQKLVTIFDEDTLLKRL